MKENILNIIGEGFAEEGKKILAALGSVTSAEPSRKELLNMLSDVTILVVKIAHAIDRDVMDSAPHLKIIATATTGLDHIDVTYAKSKGITVLSLRDDPDALNDVTATAELACGLMIALMRNMPAAGRSVLRGEWKREAFKGHSLVGKTLGIIGYGRLGKMMAGYGKALGMNVIFTDPDVKGGVEPEELLRASDVVSLHVNLTEETEGIICAEALQCMKPTAVLINTSRGKIVEEDAVIAALEAGKLAGYATDVLADELSFEGKAASPLIDYAKLHDNVLITPHIGGMTVEAREATDIAIAQIIRAACAH